MNTKVILFLFIAFIFQSCHFSSSKFSIDQSIDTATRQQIKTLNDKLFKDITNKDFAGLRSLMSPGLLNKFVGDSGKFIEQASQIQVDSYDILNEYSVQASAAGTRVTVLPEKKDDNDYTYTFQSASKNSYVSLLLLNNFGNQYLLTAVYGKYQNEWKLNILKLGQYSFFGKTAPDYYQMAILDYKKNYLVDAVDNISLSDLCLQPSGTLWHYKKEKEIADFRDSVLGKTNAKYKFPLTLENIESKPKIFRIYPQAIKEGFFPMVYYISTINFKDTIALKQENEKVRIKADSIFTGINKDKKFVFYWAFNKMPDGQNLEENRGFVDTLMKR